MRFFRHFLRSRKSVHVFSTISKTILTLFVAYIILTCLLFFLPKDSWFSQFINLVHLPVLLALLTFEISLVPTFQEVSVFLFLHDANPKSARFHWVPALSPAAAAAGTAFLEIQNTGHSFLSSFLVEVAYKDGTVSCYRIPMGLAADKSHFLQVDRGVDQIDGVKVVCFLSAEAEAFSFDGTPRKNGQTTVFSALSHDEKPRLENVQELLCCPEPD